MLHDTRGNEGRRRGWACPEKATDGRENGISTRGRRDGTLGLLMLALSLDHEKVSTNAR